jgi:peptidoglycan/LPS O-acetylase OafA/YrhL
VLAAWADIPPVRETFWWHISYTSNIYFALRGGWNGDVSHLWSLAVEEQFYLIWPWVILFAPRPRLVPITVLVAIAGPVFRLAAYSMGAGEVSIMVLPFSCSDTLAAGALLALLAGRIAVFDRRHYERVAAIGGLITSVVLLTLSHFRVLEPLTIAGLDVALAALFVAIVSRASDGLGGRVGAMLSWQPLVYLGTISYGIYVYHNFVADLLPAGALSLHLPSPSRIWGTMPAHPALSVVRHVIGLSIATCVTAAISWQLFELPINRLKHRFTYTPRVDQGDARTLAVIQPAQVGP